MSPALSPTTFQGKSQLESRRLSARGAQVAVEFCELGNYRRVAQKLAADLASEFPGQRVHCSLRPSSGGVFEVSVNGTVVFSKRATRRLPGSDEIFYHVGVALKSAAS